jgi:hypothetical protein
MWKNFWKFSLWTVFVIALERINFFSFGYHTVAAFVDTFLNAFKITSLTSSSEGQKDIFSMLEIVLTIITLMSAGAYGIIYKIIDSKLKGAEKKMRHYTTAHSLKGLSILDYERYLRYIGSNEKDSKEKAERSLGSAIEKTMIAIREADELQRMDGCGDNELLMCILKNNLAWFLYKEGNKNRKYEAYENIRYVIVKAKNHPNHADNWYHTYASVCKYFFGKNCKIPQESFTRRIKRCVCASICDR